MVEINLVESIHSCNLISLVSRFKIRRGHLIELTVSSLHVVKPLNIFEDLTLSMLRIAEEWNDIQQLRLKSREETLSHRVTKNLNLRVSQVGLEGLISGWIVLKSMWRSIAPVWS